MSDEYDPEPVRGLPERLPAGEKILWQGVPRWRSLAIRAFHARKVAFYCGLLLAWRLVSDLTGGASPAAASMGLLWILPIALAAVALPTLLAWLFARSTVFTITNRRVVLRFGVAIPMAINLPFAKIASAGLKSFRDGTGDIPLALSGGDKIAYLFLWPYARRWRFTKPEPMLRAVPDAAEVAGILAGALERAAVTAAAEQEPEQLPRIKRQPIASAA